MYSATYSPEDNKLRLYAGERLDPETYARAKALGFRWAPQQKLFFAPAWGPEREDFLIELAGEIGDEDSSLSDRAEVRAERFEGYSENRLAEAERAQKAVSVIADGIPLGQPILVGHHSERHARRDAERIENGMRKAVKAWETSKYWADRAASAIRHAKYKERPDVRARRIKTIEAEQRKVQRGADEAAKFTKAWESVARLGNEPDKQRALAVAVANHDHVSKCFALADFPRDPPASQYEGSMSLWSAITDGIITGAEAAEIAIRVHQGGRERRARWLAHFENRLAYERALLVLGEPGESMTGEERLVLGRAIAKAEGRP